MTILVQNLIVVLLLWRYMKNPPSSVGIAVLISGFVATAVACATLPSKYLVLLPYSNLPLIVLAKVPQVIAAVGVGAVEAARVSTIEVFLFGMGGGGGGWGGPPFGLAVGRWSFWEKSWLAVAVTRFRTCPLSL